MRWAAVDVSVLAVRPEDAEAEVDITADFPYASTPADWANVRVKTSPAFLPRARPPAASRAACRATASASAIRRVGVEKSCAGRPDTPCGTRSRSFDGAAKGSPWT